MNATLNDSSTRPIYVPPMDLRPVESYSAEPAPVPAELTPPAKKYPAHAMSLGKALLWVLVLFCVGYLLPGFVSGFIQGLSGVPMETTLMPLMLGGAVLGVVTGLLALRWRVGKGWAGEAGLNRLPVVPTLLALACVPGLKLLCGVISWVMTLLVAQTDPAAGFVQNTTSSYPWWFSLLLVAVAPALVEELWFRGVIGRGLVGRYGGLFGVLLASLLFGAFHMSLVQGTYAFALGVAVHLMYRATRSLWVPILVHFTFNALAVGLTMLLQAANLGDTSFDDASPAALVAIFSVLIAAALSFPFAAWGLYRVRDRGGEVAG